MRHLALALILGTSIGAICAPPGFADPLAGPYEGAKPPAQGVAGAAANQPATGRWQASRGAVISRHNDRDFHGDATANDGNIYTSVFPHCRSSDWLTFNQCDVMKYPMGVEWSSVALRYYLAGSNSLSRLALVGGCHDLNTGVAGCTGLTGAGVGDQTSGSGPVYAIYGLCQKQEAGSGACVGIEIDPSSTVSTHASDPFQQGDVIGIQDACGGQYPPAGLVNCSAAMQIEPNGALFRQGIVFASGAIAASGYSLVAPTGLLQAWYGAAGSVEGTFGDVSGRLTSTLPMAVTFAGPAAMTFTNTKQSRSMTIGLLDGFSAVIDTPRSGDLVVSDAGRQTARINTGAATFNEAVRPPQSSYANLPTFDPNPAVGDYLVIADASSCSVGAAVSAGGGSGHACPAIYNGAAWIAAVSH